MSTTAYVFGKTWRIVLFIMGLATLTFASGHRETKPNRPYHSLNNYEPLPLPSETSSRVDANQKYLPFTSISLLHPL